MEKICTSGRTKVTFKLSHFPISESLILQPSNVFNRSFVCNMKQYKFIHYGVPLFLKYFSFLDSW